MIIIKYLRTYLTAFLLLIAILTPNIEAYAHEIRPALLTITEREEGWYDVTWKVPIFEGRELDLFPIFPTSFKSLGPPSTTALQGAKIQYFTFKTDGASLAGQTITIEGLTKLQIDVLVQIRFANGSTQSTILKPKSPTYKIPKPGSKGAVAKSYWIMGVIHILSGFDHLLFVLALMLIVPNKWKLFKTITAFTLAHSVTLALASLGLVNVPPGPTEAIIALSIVFLAGEIVNSKMGRYSLAENYPWIVAMIFGLFHGLGFAGALTEIGLIQHEIPLALLMFNLGVETGQVLFLLTVLLLIFTVNKMNIKWPEASWKWLPYTIGSIASFWTIERIIGFL